MRYLPKTKESGFTLLLSVLIAGILLAIGIAIFNITIKELLISASVRDSQFAFYAADTGTECALYWDQVGGAFSTSSPSTIICNETTIENVGGQPYGTASTFSFEVGGYCSTVSVTKNDSHPRTLIESRGYNTTCESSQNARRIERAIRVTY